MKRFPWLSALIFAALPLSQACAQGVDRTWIGPAGGTFSVITNWSPTPPGSLQTTDRLHFTGQTALPGLLVNHTVSRTVNKLDINSDRIILAMTASTTLTLRPTSDGESVLTLGSTPAAGPTPGSIGHLHVSGPSTAQLSLLGLSGARGDISIGNAVGALGVLEVQNGARLTNVNTLHIGGSGVLSSGQLYIGPSSSADVVNATINGAPDGRYLTETSFGPVLGLFTGAMIDGGVWTISNTLSMDSATRLVITNGGNVAVGGTLSLKGGSIEAYPTYVAVEANSSLITHGAALGGDFGMDDVRIDLTGSATGSALWDNQSGDLHIGGNHGLSELNVFRGGRVTNTGEIFVGGGSSQAVVRLDPSLGAGADPSMSSTGDIHVLPGGSFFGKGFVTTSNVRNEGGFMAPGLSPGTLTIEGNYIQTAGKLVIEIFGSDPGQYDILQVLGAATLGGELVLDFNGHTPTAGTGWQFLTAAGGITGAFSQVTTMGLAQGFSVTGDLNQGNVMVVPEPDAALVLTAGCLVATIACGRRRWQVIIRTD